MIKFSQKLWRGFLRLLLYIRLFYLTGRISRFSTEDGDDRPIIFFNASTRLAGLSLNAAFAMIASWGVQLAGRRVFHFACKSGMSHCVLGAGLGNPTDPPPCRRCISDTGWFTRSAPTTWFEYQEDPDLKEIIQNKTVSELKQFSYRGRPLGHLILPSLRWILRRYHLEDDDTTKYLFMEYILSAENIANEFSQMIHAVNPEAVVVFNGLQYPEGVVRWVAQQHGIRVITHEVNLQPYSAFFTDGEATIYPLRIPEDFTLSPPQNQTLDEYLRKRFQGKFKMAGIQFWSAMNQLPDGLLLLMDQFDSVVPVFTNVVFDTSQAHANTIFSDMFGWLEEILKAAKNNPKTLFVIRAHPDEMREGKSSQESVMLWGVERNLDQIPNITLIGPNETFNSYELIQHSKFCLVYNSSIGLEAILLKKPVLCAGKARYTQYPIVYYPESREEYQDTLRKFLQGDLIEMPDQFYKNARRFLYYQLFRASLRFDEFLLEGTTPGYVQLKGFCWKKLLPGNSPVVDTIVSGILSKEEFLMESDSL
jgi:hypothetical protein